MATELNGWEVKMRNIKEAAEEGAEVTVKGELESSRGHSVKEWEESGSVEEIEEYKIRLSGDEHDYIIRKTGVDVTMYRVLEGKGKYGMAGVKSVIVSDGGS